MIETPEQIALHNDVLVEVMDMINKDYHATDVLKIEEKNFLAHVAGLIMNRGQMNFSGPGRGMSNSRRRAGVLWSIERVASHIFDISYRGLAIKPCVILGAPPMLPTTMPEFEMPSGITSKPGISSKSLAATTSD